MSGCVSRMRRALPSKMTMMMTAWALGASADWVALVAASTAAELSLTRTTLTWVTTPSSARAAKRVEIRAERKLVPTRDAQRVRVRQWLTGARKRRRSLALTSWCPGTQASRQPTNTPSSPCLASPLTTVSRIWTASIACRMDTRASHRRWPGWARRPL